MEVNDDALFPSKYEPHEIKIKYKGKTRDIDYSKKEMTIKNFGKKN